MLLHERTAGIMPFQYHGLAPKTGQLNGFTVHVSQFEVLGHSAIFLSGSKRLSDSDNCNGCHCG
jgi:hypothetical protein